MAPDSQSGSANPCRLVGQEQPFSTAWEFPGDEDHGETSCSLLPLGDLSGVETHLQLVEKPHSGAGRDALMEATAHGDLTQEQAPVRSRSLCLGAHKGAGFLAAGAICSTSTAHL